MNTLLARDGAVMATARTALVPGRSAYAAADALVWCGRRGAGCGRRARDWAGVAMSARRSEAAAERRRGRPWPPDRTASLVVNATPSASVNRRCPTPSFSADRRPRLTGRDRGRPRLPRRRRRPRLRDRARRGACGGRLDVLVGRGSRVRRHGPPAPVRRCRGVRLTVGRNGVGSVYGSRPRASSAARRPDPAPVRMPAAVPGADETPSSSRPM